nr:integrase, catalytic region, zinc finger, CCHC-type, peptidase aspartic, catalytic [Tanacetum cinerariifolium]
MSDQLPSKSLHITSPSTQCTAFCIGSTLRFDSAFWSCDLLLRFGYAFCSLKTVLRNLALFAAASRKVFLYSSNLDDKEVTKHADTRPPMLDKTDFASWQQRIRLYCRGKEKGVNISKSIDEGPYRMGTVRETLAESTKGAPQFGPERPREYSDLTPEEKDRYNTDIRATNILLQGLPKDIYTLINHYTDAKYI